MDSSQIGDIGEKPSRGFSLVLYMRASAKRCALGNMSAELTDARRAGRGR